MQFLTSVPWQMLIPFPRMSFFFYLTTFSNSYRYFKTQLNSYIFHKDLPICFSLATSFCVLPLQCAHTSIILCTPCYRLFTLLLLGKTVHDLCTPSSQYTAGHTHCPSSDICCIKLNSCDKQQFIFINLSEFQYT